MAVGLVAPNPKPCTLNPRTLHPERASLGAEYPSPKKVNLFNYSRV